MITTKTTLRPVAESVVETPPDFPDGIYSVAYNPYAEIDWNTCLKLKTQLHAHTSRSDAFPLSGEPATVKYPQYVMGQYRDAEYDALGISDHDYKTFERQITWPWATWYPNPENLNMVAIPNNELSDDWVHHILAPFVDYSITRNDYLNASDKVRLQMAIDVINQNDGIPILAHPWLHKVLGRSGGDRFTHKYYDGLSGFAGIEIFNYFSYVWNNYQLGNPENYDFALWDKLIANQDHVWGFACDDSHTTTVNKSWIAVCAPLKNSAAIKAAIEAGSFFAVKNSNPLAEANITSIEIVDNKITIDTADPVVWISNGLLTVGKTNILDLNALPSGLSYVRAEVGTYPNLTLTQPIFITDNSESKNIKLNSKALYMDGFENCVRIPYTSALAPADVLSFEVWAYRSVWTNYTQDVCILSKTAGGGYRLGVNSWGGSNAGYIVCAMFINGDYRILKFPLANLAGGWHHFAAVYDRGNNGRMSLYVDARGGADNNFGNYPITYAYNNSLIIGGEAGTADAPEPNFYFNGLIGEVRFYSKALTLGEIETHFNAGFGQRGTPEAGLIAGYCFEEGSGVAASDYSGNGHNGVLSSDEFWVKGFIDSA